MNQFLKSLLKTADYLVDQFPDNMDRLSSRVSDVTDRGTREIRGEESHTWRNLAGFAAGLGLGVGAGMLFAPASGKETRSSVQEKVQKIGDHARAQSSSDETIATGDQEHLDC